MKEHLHCEECGKPIPVTRRALYNTSERYCHSCKSYTLWCYSKRTHQLKLDL